MAITTDDKDKIRQTVSSAFSEVGWQKQHVNAALDEIESFWDSNKVALSAQVDVATNALVPPYTFTVAEKKLIIKHWLGKRFGRE